ncbi:MAG TPA: hypothetical protein VGD71_14815 [Kribbella sp.]
MSMGPTFPTGIGAPILLEGLQVIGRVTTPSAHPQVSSIAPEFAHFPQVDSVFKFELQSQKLREPATSSPIGGAPWNWKFRLPDYELANDKLTQLATLAEQGRISMRVAEVSMPDTLTTHTVDSTPAVSLGDRC